MSVNDATMDLLLEFEVSGGETNYNLRFKNPVWPGEASGVTIGVGYDLGYNSAATIRSDWSEHIAEPDLVRLVACAGKTGLTAKTARATVKDIIVPWEAASRFLKQSRSQNLPIRPATRSRALTI